MRSQDVFSAIESMDSDLLYDARACRVIKVDVLRRTAVAAAVILTLLAGVLIYANFVMPVAYISLESDSYALLSVNARGNVLSVTSDHKEFVSAQGKPAAAAVENVVRQMIERGDLNEEENTLLAASDRSRRDDLERTVQGVFEDKRFSGSVVTLAMQTDDLYTDAPSPAKTALMDMLSQYSEALSFDSLTKLSVNDLHLLIREMDFTDNCLFCMNEPSESKYIGREKALLNAIERSALSPVDSSQVQLAVYRHKLIYLVTLRSGDSAEAFFIDASDGTNEHTIKTTAEQVPNAVQDEVRSSNAPAAQTAPVPDTPVSALQNVDTTAENEEQEHIPPTTSLPAPTEAENRSEESSDYTEFPITMRELSFNTLTPPSSAKEVGFGALFEGQCIEERNGEKKNEGSVCIITNLSQWGKFLSENNKRYLDVNGNSCPDRFTKEYFDNHSLLVSACVFSDASYYTTVLGMHSDADSVYIDDSLSYGEQRGGEYYCYTFSVYETEKGALSSDMLLTVY